MRIKLIVNFILICNFDNGVMKSPKRRGIISLVFTCLIITIMITIIIDHMGYAVRPMQFYFSIHTFINWL